MDLPEIVPWGRGFDAYREMFRLTPAELGGRLLGCGDGPASFNAEATGRGVCVVSADPIYALEGAEIDRRVRAASGRILEETARDPRAFIWRRFRDISELSRARLRALGIVLADYDAGRAAGRYVPAVLPDLPFAEGAFDLALVSHLLLLYSDQLDLQAHVQAIAELLRVAKEVRVFPLVDLSGARSVHLTAVSEAFRSRRVEITEVGTDYEFQKGARAFLQLRGCPSG